MSVRIERQDRVTTVIIDRPQVRNAIDRATAEALAEAFLAFDADAGSDAAVLWGAGGHFCAGADLKALASGGAPNRVELDGDGPLGPTRMRLSKPVIAAVSGYAVAGGLELALWCDLRVMESDAVFGVFCRRWGVPLIDGGSIRLPRLIGQSRAMDLILTGRPVHADEALQLGLATQCARFDPAREFLKNRLNRPTPRLVTGRELRGLAHAAVDLSDGLAGDLQHILEESWVGAEIETDKLPMSEAFERLSPAASRLPLQAAGGDDYELCVCLPPEALAEARRKLSQPLTEIGRITREPGLRWLDAQGRVIDADLRAFNHFPAPAAPAAQP